MPPPRSAFQRLVMAPAPVLTWVQVASASISGTTDDGHLGWQSVRAAGRCKGTVDCDRAFLVESIRIRFTRSLKSITLNRRPSVSLLTALPKAVSSAAILHGVRPLHFTPVMGSPAVTCRISSSMREMTSSVFFPPACVRRRLCGCGLCRCFGPLVRAGPWPPCEGRCR